MAARALPAAFPLVPQKRWLRAAHAPPDVVVTAETLTLPKTPRSAGTVSLPLADIHSLEGRGTPKQPLLVIGTRDGFFVLPVASFVDGGSALELRDTLRAAIAALPDGAALLAAMDKREADGRKTVRRKPRATQVLLGVIAGLFVFELSTGALDDPSLMLRFGANAPALVHDGQWWRLCTAGLLHLSLLHVFLNGSALSSFGGIVERMLGTPRFLVVALGASVAGNVASMLTHRHVYSAGASSLLFGLVGSLLVINLRFRGALPAGFLLGWRRWASLLGLNLAISLLPGVDALAHLGGLLGGGVLTLALVPNLDLDEKTPHPVHMGLAGALVAAFLLAAGLAATHAMTQTTDEAVWEFAHATLQTDGLPAAAVNRLAEAVADDPASDSVLLADAHRAVTSALVEAPADPALTQTLQKLQQRLTAPR